MPKIVASLLRQATLPNKFHVFCSDTPQLFDTGCSRAEVDQLQKELIELCVGSGSGSGVSVEVSVVANTGPYRKLVPALRLYRNHLLLSVDDDEIFESDIVGDFVNAYVQGGDGACIVCSAARILDLSRWCDMKEPIDYYKCLFRTEVGEGEETGAAFMNLLPEGYGGVLYYSGMFGDDFLNADFESLSDELVLRNDDAFLRMYTYRRGIPVRVVTAYQANIYNAEQVKTLFRTNKRVSMTDVFAAVDACQTQFGFVRPAGMGGTEAARRDIAALLALHSEAATQLYKRSVHTGTDVKKLQYKICYDAIRGDNDVFDIHACIRERFGIGKAGQANTVLVNLERDEMRYHSAVREFKLLCVQDFVHLKATYWKERDAFCRDMNSVLAFLRPYNAALAGGNGSESGALTFDALFSQFSDPNIQIQDGPLACYCSHVRALIYGFLHFADYTVVVEDDFHINDLATLRKQLRLVPDDWDVICCGAQPIHRFYEGACYKFTDLFHSTQFYIVRNACMPMLFSGVYPIVDQIDILISKMHAVLNIYNIPNVIMQKNYETNTQNNLYVIYNSPNYEYLRTTLASVKSGLCDVLCEAAGDSDAIDAIAQKMIFDVVFNRITSLCGDESSDNKEISSISSSSVVGNGDGDGKAAAATDATTYDAYFVNTQREKLRKGLYIVINSCVKGVDVEHTVDNMLDDLYHIVDGFRDGGATALNLHLRPLNYGSTSNVFLDSATGHVVKVYVDELRWKHSAADHCDSLVVMRKEADLLARIWGVPGVPQLINYDEQRRTLVTNYLGRSLFDQFVLPPDWREQLRRIFHDLEKCGIEYPEFNLKNIVCSKDGSRLGLVDFGLAKVCDINTTTANNSSNANAFIQLVELMQDKMSSAAADNVEQRHVLYHTLLTNAKREGAFEANLF